MKASIVVNMTNFWIGYYMYFIRLLLNVKRFL